MATAAPATTTTTAKAAAIRRPVRPPAFASVGGRESANGSVPGHPGPDSAGDEPGEVLGPSEPAGGAMAGSSDPADES